MTRGSKESQKTSSVRFPPSCTRPVLEEPRKERSVSVRLESQSNPESNDQELHTLSARSEHQTNIVQDIRRRLESPEEEIVVIQSAPATASNSLHQPPHTRRLLSDGAITHDYVVEHRRRRNKRHRRRDYVSNYRPRKLVVVGDMHCGKTSLVSSYCSDKFSDMYTPTILRCLHGDTKIRGKLIDIVVVDTPGRYDYLPLRQVAYKKTDLVMICFALDDPQSLENVEKFWVPEVEKNAPGIPYMLVGNRRDYRDEVYANWCCCEICQDCHLGCEKGFNTLKKMQADKFLHSAMLSYDQGCLMAEQVGAVGYEECSAKFRDNTRSVFECATELALKKYRRKRRHTSRGPEACVIL